MPRTSNSSLYATNYNGTRFRTTTKRTISLILTLLVAISWLVAPTTFAASRGFGINCPGEEIYIGVFDACLDFGEIVGTGVNWAMILGTMIALTKFAIGAIQFILSSGDPTKLENARTTVTDALIGLTLLVSAWVLLGYLSAAFPEDWQINFFVLFG